MECFYISDKLGNFVSKIPELGFVGTGDICNFFFCIFYFTSIFIVYNRYSVQNNTLIKTDGCSNIGVVLLLWFCDFHFLFCVFSVFFCPAFEDVLTSTRSITLFLECFLNIQQNSSIPICVLLLLLYENMFYKICTLWKIWIWS